MSGRVTWHDRPFLAPFVYLVSTFAIGSVGYAFGFLITDKIKNGIYASLFLEGLFVLYLLESHRVARKGKSC